MRHDKYQIDSPTKTNFMSFAWYNNMKKHFDSCEYREVIDNCLTSDPAKPDFNKIANLVGVAHLDGRLDIVADLMPMSDEFSRQVLEAVVSTRPEVLEKLIEMDALFPVDSVIMATVFGQDEHLELFVRKGYPVVIHSTEDSLGSSRFKEEGVSPVGFALKYHLDDKVRMLVRFGAQVNEDEVANTLSPDMKNLAIDIKAVQDENRKNLEAIQNERKSLESSVSVAKSGKKLKM